MAPEAPEPPAPLPAHELAGHDGGSAAGDGPHSARAPLRWPQTRRPRPHPQEYSSARGAAVDGWQKALER